MTREHLQQKDRQLDLLMALDRARDAVESHADPNAMFDAIVSILKDFFQADVCAVMLVAENSDELECIATSGVSEHIAIELCRQSMRMAKPTAISSDLYHHNLGIHIIHDAIGASLGGLFLARKTAPFTQADIDLLEVAESQIDSAIMQARLIWNIANRNRELEAIYQLDRMRDSNPDENELISHFTSILTESFQAEVALLFLSHIDSGEMMLRGIVDKNNMPLSAVETIRGLTGHLNLPQVIQPPPEIQDIDLLAAPLIVAGIKMGSVVVGRHRAFTVADHRMLFALMSQMDSAIVHSRVIQQLHQRNKELETIYHIDKIRDSENEFDVMLQQVLAELCKVVSSEMGYLMLYNEREERQLELKATTVDGVLASPIYHDVIKRTSQEALRKGEPVYSNKLDGAVRSIVAIPLILNERLIGVFGTVNSTNPRGFSAEDRRMLTAVTSQVDTAVFERLERRRMRKVMSRSVDPKVLEHLLQHADEHVLIGDRVVISTLFADLRGSTEWAERTDPGQLVTTLNAFLGKMTDVIFKFNGTLDKFVGDEVIALFGSPVPMKDHALQAARCALEMQKAQAELRAELQAQGIELPPMGVGISSGEVIAGEFGTPIRTDFTAIGRVMNLGARLCSAAEAGQICISKATTEMIGDRGTVRLVEGKTLKGIGEVTIYELVSVKEYR